MDLHTFRQVYVQALLFTNCFFLLKPRQELPCV